LYQAKWRASVTPSYKKCLAGCLKSIVLLFALTSSVCAGNWTKQPYAHYADKEPVVELLQQFASSFGIPAIISNEVTGVVSGQFEETAAKKFLDNISSVHNLIWYHDGMVLYVYHSKEIITSIVDLKSVSPKRLLQALNSLGILNRKYSFRSIANEGIVLLSGPPRYIELVKGVVDMIVSSHIDKSKDDFVVKVFPLKYAWADDRNIKFNGQLVKSPGIASTLQSILGRDLPAPTAPLSHIGNSIDKLKGHGMAVERNSNSKRLAEAERRRPTVERQTQQQSDFQNQPGEAYIIANERINAVIVHDRFSKMPLYEELINSLDIPINQVEIEVSIIDVSTDKLEDMGVEWQASGSRGSFATSDFTNGALPRDTNELSLLLGNDVNFSTILNGTQDYFLTRIRMLSEKGDAKVLSQPSILTLDNTEALLDHSTTFYVRLAGENEVDLFPVSVGSVVRVTPHIINEFDQNKIHLDIKIEDGQQTDATVDDIPTVSKSMINTQALINDNGSLLIGGYYYNQDIKTESKVPLLGDLPLLGWLFRSESVQIRKTARLFLITPRIVFSDSLNSTSDRVKSYIEMEKLGINAKLNIDEDDFLGK
jgi:type III secretion protein C